MKREIRQYYFKRFIWEVARGKYPIIAIFIFWYFGDSSNKRDICAMHVMNDAENNTKWLMNATKWTISIGLK